MTEKCSSCEQMKKENKLVRKALIDTSVTYTEVVNENLALHRRIEELERGAKMENTQEVVFKNNIHETPIVKEVQVPVTQSLCNRGCCSSDTPFSHLDHPQIGAN